MSNYLFVFALLFLCLNATAQEKGYIYPNEFTISINTFKDEDDATESRMGFGVGIFHSYAPKSFLNMMFGVEFNQFSQYDQFVYNSRSSHYEDVIYKFNYIGVRFIPRFITGNKFRFFCDPGLQLNLPVLCNYKGQLISHNYPTG